MKKQQIFKIIAILLPLLFLGIVELILRSVNYGSDYQLFHKVLVEDQPDYLVMNKKMAGKYFKDNELRSDNQSDLFLKEKTDSTFRVVVQGASTVVGFPFYRGGSFPRMLKHRLSLTFPDKNMEVINTGMTAVNSYTLWDLTDDIIKQDPDLVIIYAGHNEYYGALGAGSSITYGSHPFLIRSYLKLKQFRLFQLIENGYYKIVSPSNNKPSERHTTLMEVLAKEQRIPYNSDVFKAGAHQFESNLDRILSRYKSHDIPVIVSTLVSNEKDIKPFISDTLANTDQFLEAVEQHQPYTYDRAQSNALAAYYTGEHYGNKSQDSAKKYFNIAKELDYLRFRAPDTINEIIKKISQKHNNILVDMEAVFRAHSPTKSIGNELMTEHVHPNIKGQFLMADAFYHKIKDMHLLDDWTTYISFEDAYNDIPVTAIDSLKGTLVIEELKRSWPYDMDMSGRRPDATLDTYTTYDEKIAYDLHTKVLTWDNAMAIAYNVYRGDKDYEKGLHVAESLIFEYPEQAKVYEMAGTMCLNLGEFEKAIYYLKIFNKREQSSSSAEILSQAYIKANREDMAKQVLKNATLRGLDVKVFKEIYTASRMMDSTEFKD